MARWRIAAADVVAVYSPGAALGNGRHDLRPYVFRAAEPALIGMHDERSAHTIDLVRRCRRKKHPLPDATQRVPDLLPHGNVSLLADPLFVPLGKERVGRGVVMRIGETKELVDEYASVFLGRLDFNVQGRRIQEPDRGKQR